MDFEHPTLQGVGNGDMAPRALPWAEDLLGFQPAQGSRQGFFRTISIYLIVLDFEQTRVGGCSKLFSCAFYAVFGGGALGRMKKMP